MSNTHNTAFGARSNEKELVDLIQNYLTKTEELEDKEGKVLKQVEMVRSALLSLQVWNEKRKSNPPPTAPVQVLVNTAEVEEETRKIEEETKRIQEEVRQKTEQNKKLEEELLRRRKFSIMSPIEKRFDTGSSTPERQGSRKISDRREIRTRSLVPEPSLDNVKNKGIEFFNYKLKKLMEMEKKLKRESKEQSEILKNRKKKLQEKIEMLEWESEIDRQMIQAMKKKLGKNSENRVDSQ